MGKKQNKISKKFVISITTTYKQVKHMTFVIQSVSVVTVRFEQQF